MRAQVRIGTSGWHYKHWCGAFYQEKLPASKMLETYFGHFDTVEINNSFYKLPSAETFRCWRESTPPGVQPLLVSPRHGLAGGERGVHAGVCPLRSARKNVDTGQGNVPGGAALQLLPAAGGIRRSRARRQPSFSGAVSESDWPQAWSASAPFTMLQALLGLYPYAPLNVLFVDPWLPEWLPEISLINMRVGKAAISLRFRRKEDGRTDYEILELRGPLHVIRQPSPWSLTAGWAERVYDAVSSLLPKAA